MDNTQDKAINLHRILFAQLERLSGEEIDTKTIDLEIKRTKSICQVSDQILKLADIGLREIELEDRCGKKPDVLPRLLS